MERFNYPYNQNKSIVVDDVIGTRLYQILTELEQEGRYDQTKKYYHHWKTTIYEHCINVAYVSCVIANKLQLYVNYDVLIRGALLHDYYLYDWYIRSKEHILHGFSHPGKALKNAEQDYDLEEVEKNMISCHMFPLTPIPPLAIGRMARMYSR